VRSYGEAQGIATEAWSPIAQGAVETIDNLDPGEAGRQGPDPDSFAHVPE
jgi:diketogulonate reductase-like aldo/keto reductase